MAHSHKASPKASPRGSPAPKVSEEDDLKERWNELSKTYDNTHKAVSDELHKLTADQPMHSSALTAGQKKTVSNLEKEFKNISKPTASGNPTSKDLQTMKSKTDELNKILNEIYKLNDEVAVTD